MAVSRQTFLRPWWPCWKAAQGGWPIRKQKYDAAAASRIVLDIGSRGGPDGRQTLSPRLPDTRGSGRQGRFHRDGFLAHGPARKPRQNRTSRDEAHSRRQWHRRDRSRVVA